MTRARRRFFRVWTIAAAFAGFVAPSAFGAASPEEIGADLAARHDNVVAELQRLQENDELSPESALQLIRGELSPLIDFRRLAGQAAGKYWRRAKDEEKARIVAAFRGVLESVYAGVLARYGGQRVRILESKLRGDGTVAARVEVSDGKITARIDYVFYEREGEMRISDVLVEGISLLDTYRRQFAQIARKEGTAGLASRLEELAQR